MVFLFAGCTSVSQDRVERVFQTNSANSMKKDYKELSKQLIVFKDKLDKRNPSAYNRTISNAIYTNMNNSTNGVTLKFNNVKLNSYKEYLQMAFSKIDIQNRNDFLVLGLYKEIYEAYDIRNGHQLTALTYNKQKLQNLYQNLQIVKWKLSTGRDAKDEYLFLTWQNNWQIELETALKQNQIHTYDDILNLRSIKEGHESLLSQSNASFEVILTSMISRVKTSLETIGVEPVDVGIEAVKTMFIFL
ncbi:MAG: hypothetical protein WCR15_07485 [Arcobacteraceae bacterium]